MTSKPDDCMNLTTINYGSNFIYKDNAKVYNMFNNCKVNKSTDSSWQNVSF